MHTRWLRSIGASALVIATLALSSCEQAPQDSMLGPQVRPQASVEQGGYTIITETPPGGPLVVKNVIGVLGGSLSVAGHTITVPKNALSAPALFSMKVGNQGVIEVEVTALGQLLSTTTSLLGGTLNTTTSLLNSTNLVDIGSLGFNKPVTLTLTYSRATNVTNPGNLTILRDNDSGPDEILPSSVNTTTKTVSAKLEHFSRYVLICD